MPPNMRITVRLTPYEQACLADLQACMLGYTRSQVLRAAITRTHGDLVRSGAIGRLRRRSKSTKKALQKEMFNDTR